MNPNRRDFMRQGLGSTALVSSVASVPAFVARSAALLAAEERPAKTENVLVIIELNGGNDGLNTVVPYADENYRRHRPTLAVPADRVRKIDDRLGLHSALAGFDKLLDRGELTVVQGVGYPNPKRSHFESMAVWQSGRFDATRDESGWLARAIDRLHSATDADPAALHVRELASLPQALAGGELAVLSLSGPEQFRCRVGLADSNDPSQQRARLAELGRQVRAPRGTLLQFVERSAAITDAGSARFAQLADSPAASSDDWSQTGLARRLKFIAQMIKAALATRIYYTELLGFDTHTSQAGTHTRLLAELGDSMEAFLSDLRAAGVAERVLVLVFSEFGRRLAENASGGTDHGTAAPMFLAGGAARRPFIGPCPDLTDLDASGDPKFAIDFRQVYAAVLDDWLACPSALVLGEKFERLPLFTANSASL